MKNSTHIIINNNHISLLIDHYFFLTGGRNSVGFDRKTRGAIMDQITVSSGKLVVGPVTGRAT